MEDIYETEHKKTTLILSGKTRSQIREIIRVNGRGNMTTTISEAVALMHKELITV